MGKANKSSLNGTRTLIREQKWQDDVVGPPNLDSRKGRGLEWASQRVWCLTKAGESVGNDLGKIAKMRKDVPGRGASMYKGLF